MALSLEHCRRRPPGRLPALLALAAGWVLSAHTANSDTILLKDGTVVTGKVTGYKKGQFEIDGEPRFRIEEVMRIQPEEEDAGAVKDATTEVSITWGGRQVTVIAFPPVELIDAGRVPRSFGFYTDAQQFFGGNLLFKTERPLAQATLSFRMFRQEGKNKVLIDSPEIDLFDVQPGRPVPFVVNLFGRNTEQFTFAVLTLETFRLRGRPRKDAGRGRGDTPPLLRSGKIPPAVPVQPGAQGQGPPSTANASPPQQPNLAPPQQTTIQADPSGNPQN